MPKDKNGTELEVGDPVVLLGRIKTIEETPEGRNCEVELDGPSNEQRPTVHVNGRLLAVDV